MSLLRGLLFDNLGLKLTALLLAVLVYLHVYTERPAQMMFSFPIQLTEVDTTLSLSGPVPSAVVAEVRGTGKQLIRLRLAEPVLKVSLSGVARGRYERLITEADLPVSAADGIQIDHLVGPRTLALQLDHKVRRRLPVAVRIEGDVAWSAPILDPPFVTVTGPESAVSQMDSVALGVVRVDSRRDTTRAKVAPALLPDWTVSDPPIVLVRVPRAGIGPR
jgi:YbbR domain-containing protein